ncbi:type IX secretion system outer membrane channel protein PorV [uncultured Dysgonomonas sp.]|uniref:Type IX secretion system protein PorV domain-containing protein n=1 Tax=uncultured Dysgonomonas sp. TaxID=206096 RepID=A0A212K528_9BACT|nr:type IX secretion system outer membrane channel protein PorV [uncultured Dysgonomonas sp.]SBW06766.1 conserved exported hypothetical protein [uncultured Dysgonomonas sp.]
MRNIVTKILILICLFISVAGFSQNKEYNPIETAVPSLTIAPDARSGGMGDVGAATMPDAYSQYWNPAKYAFATSKASFALSYTPWMRSVVNGISLLNAVGYYKLGIENNQALSASLRYFSIGDVYLADAQGEFISTVAPSELAVDIGYSRKLTETFSGSVVIRYLRANYSGIEDEGTSDGTFAADIAGYNESYINIGKSESLLGIGFNISNVGGKISNGGYNRESFIPANLRVGASLIYPLDEKNSLTIAADLNKLLVPTPPVLKDGESIEDYRVRVLEYEKMSSFKGIFKSFGDAPGGFSEEMKEITWALGLEYDYDSKFRLRTGYANESAMKGNRKYLTFGTGLKINAFQLDAAYILATNSSNPLDQTLRFSLAFDFEAIMKLLNK